LLAIKSDGNETGATMACHPAVSLNSAMAAMVLPNNIQQYLFKQSSASYCWVMLLETKGSKPGGKSRSLKM
jgi:hypothetical protein